MGSSCLERLSLGGTEIDAQAGPDLARHASCLTFLDFGAHEDFPRPQMTASKIGWIASLKSLQHLDLSCVEVRKLFSIQIQHTLYVCIDTDAYAQSDLMSGTGHKPLQSIANQHTAQPPFMH